MFQTGSVLQYAQEAATTEDAPWILLQNGFATCHKINRSAGKIQKGCRSEVRLRYTIIDRYSPPNTKNTHIRNHISIAYSYVHLYIHFPGSSLPVHKQPVRKWTPRCVSPVLLVPLACWVNIPPWEVASCSNIEAWGFSCFKSYFQYEGNTDASYSTCLQCIPLVVSGGQDLKQHSKFHHHPPGRWSNQLAGIAQEVGERAARLLPIGFWRRVILVNQKWEAYICNVVLVFTSVYVYLSTYEYI